MAISNQTERAAEFSLAERLQVALSSRPTAIFSAILLAFLLCEAWIFRIHTLPMVSAETDGVLYYIPWAQGPLLRIIEPFHGPGYPVAIKFVGFFFRDLFFSAKLVSTLSGCGLLLAVWVLFRSFGITLAQSMCATALLALTPMVLLHSNTIMSDMLGAALFWGACALLIAPEQPRGVVFFAAGLLSGGAYLVRYNYLTIFILPLFGLLFCARKSAGEHMLRRILPFFVGFLCVTLPWMLTLYQQKGTPFWSEDQTILAFALHPDWNNFPTAAQFPSMKSVIAAYPSLFFKSWFRTLVLGIPKELSSLIAGTGPGIVAVAALVFLSKMNRRRALLNIAIAAQWCAIALNYENSRYLLPMLPFLCLAITDLLFAIALGLEKWPALARYAVPTGVFLTLPFLANEARHCTPGALAALFRSMAPEYRPAMDWITGHHGPNDTVFAGKPDIPFQSSTEWLDFRDYKVQSASLEEFARIVEQVQPTFVVFNEIYDAQWFPSLSPLLDPATATPPNLRPVLRIDRPRRLVVYEFTGSRANPPLRIDPHWQHPTRVQPWAHKE